MASYWPSQKKKKNSTMIIKIITKAPCGGFSQEVFFKDTGSAVLWCKYLCFIFLIKTGTMQTCRSRSNLKELW